MALAEARAAWQRTANRCLVQEDAKRAPKLAACPSVTPSVKNPETEPVISDSSQDIPSIFSLPINRIPSSNNLSPSSRWWLQIQPNYGHRQVMACEQFTPSGESQNLELLKEGSEKFEDTSVGSCEFSKSADDVYFDSEKNVPWWRTTDTEELALLVGQKSLDVLENCDLPRPQSARVKKDVAIDMCYFSRDEISTSLVVRKADIGSHGHVRSHDCSVAGYSCRKHQHSGEIQLVSRERPTHNKSAEGGTSRAQLLEALRHSQTRAREAEEVMKRACAEKEHVIRLVLRQASQIFAYKQLIQLLQLENMYIQFKNTKNQSRPTLSPVTSPNWATTRNRKMRKSGWPECSKRKPAKRAQPGFDVGKYAIVFALGLGLVSAGLLLGWTIGWMVPTW